ncbi:MAG: hypothetical protein QOJ40_2654 [Verrucomicrobiota bacterium]
MDQGFGLNDDGRQRVIIERVSPEIDAGRFPIKRAIGEEVIVEADIFSDGHDALSAVLKFHHSADSPESQVAMAPLVNDRWRGSFTVTNPGIYSYTLEAWVNPFRTWRSDLEKKFKAGLDVSLELIEGASLIQAAAERAEGPQTLELQAVLKSIETRNPSPMTEKVVRALNPRLAEIMDQHSAPVARTKYARDLRVVVDPIRARFGAWYELFPRSCAPEPHRHGTFRDCEALLPRIAGLGFDVLYLPPIHPIGRSFRKGKNNGLTASPEDPGSPWAIGAPEGGHKSVHSDLGTLEDFRRLVQKARSFNIETALDIAFQCSPDHPYVREHLEWFRRRPNGSIQYAENPPKKYEDIYPFNFESDDWRALWTELKSIFEFWIEQGVGIFRVDNPHTKPIRFWEWCLTELKRKNPELIFLSEAFTRPKVMRALAKVGFTQSYNYFPWRNTKYELTTYFTELTQSEARDYLRPNLWPNTPDILTQYLQYGGKPAFMARLVLAATLGASYGIYGPPFEFCEDQPREPGSEEYLNSEKFEIRHWNFIAPTPLSDLIARINRIRRENPALHSDQSLRFHETDNEQLIAYSKQTKDLDSIILTIVNLDPHHTQRGWITLPVQEWGLSPTDTCQFHDLLTEARYLWTGARNYVELNPQLVPAHVFRLRRYVRTEHNFDYYL